MMIGVENKGASPMYVAGVMIPAGETRGYGELARALGRGLERRVGVGVVPDRVLDAVEDLAHAAARNRTSRTQRTPRQPLR